jgi:lipopolysaccharide/colanic/teichoic acid biosynthesis glycosyltransferase
MSRPYDRVKRGIDILAAVALLIAAAPIMAAVAVAILMTMGRPVLFRQRRAGRHGRPFTLVKFRSMRPGDPNAGTLGNVATDGERLTRLGRVLRATSLDELPSLWHVLRGEMSLVGPRPLPVEYLDRYTPEQRRRHDVRPGITGLAQVRGRNRLSWEEKLRLDVSYVDSYGLGLDTRVLLETVVCVLRRSGVSAEGTATAPVFTGAKAR